MNQLKKDFKYLHGKWIVKPSKISIDDFNDLDEETHDISNRYNLLILNNIFLKRNNLPFEETKKVMNTWKNNWRTKVMNDFNLDWVNGDIISYPLNQIFIYLHENEDKLKNNNIKQLDIAEKFGVKSLIILNQIVKDLWFSEKLWWKIIKLSVEQFKILVEEFEVLERENNTLTWEDIFTLWIKTGINNPENLFAWLSAIWASKKYWIKKLRFTDNWKVLKVKNYIKKNYWTPEKSNIFERDDIFDIVYEMSEYLPEDESRSIGKITSLLRFFWYTVSDIRKHNNKK